MPDSIILHSTGCPKCEVLKKKLNEKGVDYTENHDVEVMFSLGLTHVPILDVNGELLEFADAVAWINQR